MMGRYLKVIFAAVLSCAAMRSEAAEARHVFADSIIPVGGGAAGSVVRTSLTSDENGTPMDFSVSLKLRNLDELQTRIQSGVPISQAEKEARYFPLQSDYDRTVAWLLSEGFTVDSTDSSHTNVFARGTVAAVAKSLGVTFARVANSDGEFTSAITAPSLPADIADPILGIDGLQPHVRAHPPRHRTKASAVTSVGPGFFTPADISAAYQVPASLTGAGQTIGIIMDATVSTSDLATFWTTAGVAQTTANFTPVSISGGPSNLSQSNDGDEAALDAEWSGAIAPGAKIRLYSIPSLSNNFILAACTQILNDTTSGTAPTLRVVSMSFGGTESGSSNSLNQEFTLLAAAGITPCAASGDGGSRPSNSTGLYSTSSSLSVSYPASDPYVIGVGGTTLSFDANYNYLSETTWFQNSGNNSSSGSGGGFSAIFSRPSWQAGTGVPTTNAARCVPDVSAVSNGSQPSSGNQQFGAFFVVGGQTDPNGEGVEGTSLATQVFAGLLADASQARGGQAFQAPLGQYLYPLIGTNAFNDITTGSNGISINGSIQYSATVGYDLCTGIGTPNMTNLVVALGGILPPTITSQPQSTTTTAGSSFSFSVTATGGGTLSYQWYLNGSAVSNQTSSTYFNGSATAGNAGSYTVVVSNAAGSVTSNAATLTVNGAAAAAPAPASSGGGGGGGAPSLWFYAALALVCAARGLIQGRDGRGRPSLPH